MSGHSKWSTIKRKKASVDAKRGKIFTQLIRELTVAAKEGGGNPDSNSRLRLAIEHARAQNMPGTNIERAIKRGTGGLEGESFAEVRYEGYGPGGVAVMVDVLTDNRNRSVGEIRHLFSKCGGNLGANGCVAYLFEQRGVLVFDVDRVDADSLMEVALEADADDLLEEEDTLEVRTGPERFDEVRRAFEERGLAPASAEISMIPQTTTRLEGKEAASMLKLLEALDDHDDVKQVYANFDISEEEMRQAMSAA